MKKQLLLSVIFFSVTVSSYLDGAEASKPMRIPQPCVTVYLDDAVRSALKSTISAFDSEVEAKIWSSGCLEYDRLGVAGPTVILPASAKQVDSALLTAATIRAVRKINTTPDLFVTNQLQLYGTKDHMIGFKVQSQYIADLSNEIVQQAQELSFDASPFRPLNPENLPLSCRGVKSQSVATTFVTNGSDTETWNNLKDSIVVPYIGSPRSTKQWNMPIGRLVVYDADKNEAATVPVPYQD